MHLPFVPNLLMNSESTLEPDLTIRIELVKDSFLRSGKKKMAVVGGHKRCFARIAQLNVSAMDSEKRKTTSGVLRIRNLDTRYYLSSSPYDSHP